MKVKLGTKIINFKKDAIIADISQKLTVIAIVSGKSTNFNATFKRYKELATVFLRENPNLVYSFTDEDWLEQILNFESHQHNLMLQDVMIKFEDGSTWSINLTDIAHQRLRKEPSRKYTLSGLLEEPVALVEWAEKNLSWDILQEYAILRMIDDNHDAYAEEWGTVLKKVIQWRIGDN